MRNLLRALAPCVLLALPGCLNVSPPGTAFASEPAGARILVAGRDSGWVTPCVIALDADEEHLVRFQLEGHAPRELLLVPLERHRIIDWYTGVNGVRSTIRTPVFMPLADLLLPLREIRTLGPGRVFVRLRPTDGSLTPPAPPSPSIGP
jgi:hypothetical protein